MSTDTRRAEYLSAAETAKLVRGALKEAFPDQRFSVRSDTYAGGASIHVSYLDGPLADEVKRVTDAFRGADFDGMIDLKTYRGDVELPGGRLVRFGADFIFAGRSVSAAFRETLIGRFEELYGEAYDPDRVYEERTPGHRNQWREPGSTLLYRLAQVTRGPAGARLPKHELGDR